MSTDRHSGHGLASDDALYRLLAWLSPGFPVGAYSFSHGLEFAVDQGLVHDAVSLSSWLAMILNDGAGRVDATLFCAAHRAVSANEPTSLGEVAGWAAALRPTAELATENTAQGAAFVTTMRQAWPQPEVICWLDVLDRGAAPVTYPVAVAAVTAASKIAVSPALVAYLHAFIANIVSAGVRLIPLGQTDGQRTIAAFAGVVADAADSAIGAPADQWCDALGAATPMVDWASLSHETQYTRLFRS